MTGESVYTGADDRIQLSGPLFATNTEEGIAVGKYPRRRRELPKLTTLK